MPAPTCFRLSIQFPAPTFGRRSSIFLPVPRSIARACRGRRNDSGNGNIGLLDSKRGGHGGRLCGGVAGIADNFSGRVPGFVERGLVLVALSSAGVEALARAASALVFGVLRAFALGD